MLAYSLVLASAMVLGAEAHLAVNPVFQQLVGKGVSPAGETFVPLPEPLMTDGLDAAAQRKIIEQVAKPSYSFDRFTATSTVAPHVLKMQKLTTEDPKIILRTVDAYFVAYGDMDALTNKNVLQDAFAENRQEQAEATGVALTPAELAERAIVIPSENAEQEDFGQTTMQILNRVELSVVGRSFWSRSKDSVVTAAIVDARFSDDAKYANVWRPLVRDQAGVLKRGAPQPYRGAGVYLKITKLAAPQGALFVETHVIYAEPHGWFDGNNLLGAKIPAVMRQKVQEIRQEMLRAGQKPKVNAGAQ